MGDSKREAGKVRGVRIRVDSGSVVEVDRRMLESMVAFVCKLLEAGDREDRLKGIGRTEEELREWLDGALKRPGYGVPAAILNYVGPDLADIGAATEELRLVEVEPAEDEAGDSDMEGAEPDVGSDAVGGEAMEGNEQGTLIPAASPVGDEADDVQGNMPATEGGADHKVEGEPLMHISVRGQTVAVDLQMLRALVGYVGELLRAHTAQEIKRDLGRTAEELGEWREVAEEKSGMAIPRALLRHIGTELADIESATIALAAKPSVRALEEVESEAAAEVAAVDATDEAKNPLRTLDADSRVRGEPAGQRRSAGVSVTNGAKATGADEARGEGVTPAGRETPARIVRVEPVEGELEWFGEATEFAMRRWRDLRADWLLCWESGERETKDGLLMREYMLRVELDLVENHKMTLTSGLPWVGESIEWDELTRQEQASWRRRELDDVLERRIAVQKRAARWKRLRRMAIWPRAALRGRGG